MQLKRKSLRVYRNRRTAWFVKSVCSQLTVRCFLCMQYSWLTMNLSSATRIRCRHNRCWGKRCDQLYVRKLESAAKHNSDKPTYLSVHKNDKCILVAKLFQLQNRAYSRAGLACVSVLRRITWSTVPLRMRRQVCWRLPSCVSIWKCS